MQSELALIAKSMRRAAAGGGGVCGLLAGDQRGAVEAVHVRVVSVQANGSAA